MSSVSDDGITPDQRQQIDELCAAMDRESILAGTPSGHGRVLLDDARDIWIQCAREGRPLPDRWCADEIEADIQERLAAHGTREWRKAYPWMAERMRSRGINV